jgi:VIT1/CCC1 family predicted Fe2+/Mn2+ transporter
MRDWLQDRLNVAWLVSALVLVAALLLVPNEGAGTAVLIAVGAVAIGVSGAIRIRDARRDRERKALRRDSEGRRTRRR